MEFLLLIIIGLLTYIAFFTPEKRERRARERTQELMNKLEIEETDRVGLKEFVDNKMQEIENLSEKKKIEEENFDKVVKEQIAIDLANGIPPYKTEGELWNAIFRGEPRNEEHLQARITLLKDLEEQAQVEEQKK